MWKKYTNKPLTAICPRCGSSEGIDWNNCIYNEYIEFDDGTDGYIEWYRCTDCDIDVELEYRLVTITGELCGNI